MGNAMKGFKTHVTQQLKEPGRSPIGMYLLNSGFPKENGYLEVNAVKLCKIQPQHNVLEIGFGPGIGLETAFPLIKDGPGKLYGVDWSVYCCDHVAGRMKQELESGQLMISHDSVMFLPFDDNYFDRVYHTNCYYFWTNMEQACGEMFRVMKPDSFMVTCMNMKRIKENQDKGLLQDEKPDPLNFLLCLERVGFEDIKVNYLKDESTGQDFEAIVAHVRDKEKMGNLIEELAREELTLELEVLEEKMG